MGGMLGGGGSSGGGGGLGGGGGGGSLLDPLGIFSGGTGGGGGFLSNLIGKLPDPLGLGKMLGITGQQEPGMQQQGGPPPMPAGATFAPQPQSGVSANTTQMGYSPMGPTGFGVGGGQRR